MISWLRFPYPLPTNDMKYIKITKSGVLSGPYTREVWQKIGFDDADNFWEFDINKLQAVNIKLTIEHELA